MIVRIVIEFIVFFFKCLLKLNVVMRGIRIVYLWSILSNDNNVN